MDAIAELVEELRVEVARLRLRVSALERPNEPSLPYPYDIPQQAWTDSEARIVADRQRLVMKLGRI